MDTKFVLLTIPMANFRELKSVLEQLTLQNQP